MQCDRCMDRIEYRHIEVMVHPTGSDVYSVKRYCLECASAMADPDGDADTMYTVRYLMADAMIRAGIGPKGSV